MIEEVDYIVVGAGSAGCLLANRLSKDPAHRVLLIEAGERDWNPLIRIPLVAGLLYFMKSLNWNYATEPEPGLDGRRIVWPRGRVLGGSSAINGMMHIRGHPQDYEHWRAEGLPHWGYADVLPYFKAFERNTDHPETAQYHGCDGELHTTLARGEHPIYGAWLEAALQAGFAPNGDFNGPEQEGVGLYDFNILAGRRVSAATAFLAPVRSRRNLEIVTGASVRRLVFEGTTCVGVEVEASARRVIRARREVALSAGAINSPALLQHSGVGDATRLRALGIDVVAHRAQVGRNLQDHLGVYVQHRCLEPITLYGLMRPDRAIAAGVRALLFGTGPAASVPLEAGGFLKTRADLDIPDVHVTVVPGLSLATTQVGQMEHGFLTNVYQLRPRSRGEVFIASADARDKPRMQANYLTDDEDRRCLRDGVRLVRRIVEQPAMDRLRGAEIAPGAAVQADDEVDEWVRATSNTIFHPVGTCRMGTDPDSVVDECLRVRGVQRLRVIDASVMPTIIGGNTSAPTMMIAERAAAMILGRS